MDQLDELMARPPASTGLTTTTVDPLDAAMDGYVNGKQTQVKASLNLNVEANPDEFARQKRIASLLGSPVAAVQALPKDADRAAKIRQIENDTAQAPKLRDMYTDADFTKLAHDDSGVLSRVEKAFTAFTSGISKGSIQDELGDLNYRAMTGNITPEQQARRTQLKGQMTKLDTQAQDDNSVLDYILNQTGYTGRQVVSSFREGGKGALAGASAGAIAGGVAGAVLPPTELITVPGAASLGARAGFVASSAVYNYKMEAGFAYDEFADMKDVNGKPLPNDVAVGAAAAVGLINAGLETTGEMFMAKLFPGMDKLLAQGGKEAVKAMLAKPTVRAALASAGKKWVTAASAEGITEALQELSTIFGREVAQGVSGQEFKPDELGDDAKRIAQAGMDAFVGSMGVGAAPSGYHARQQVKQAQQQQRNAEFIQALGDDATESKLRERMPDKYAEFVAKAKEDGPVQNIYIPAEQFQTFFQSQNIDPAEVATQAGATNYTEALAAGTDVVIPVEKYAATLAGSQFHQGLAPDIRLHQGDMTAREFSEYQANQEASIKEIQDRMDELVAAQQKQGGINQAIEEIVRDTEGQLIGAGTEASTAKAQATLMRGMAVLAQRETQARAQRDGREATQEEIYNDAMALWQRYGLTVSRPMPEVLAKNPKGDINIDPLIDALRAGAFPQDRDIFGAGLAEFIRNAGGIVPSGEANTAQENMERRPFQKNLVQKNGMSLDHALEKAVQAGYFPGREQGDLTEADFLDALDNDLRGGGVFSIHAADNNKLAMREAMNSLGDYLDSLGIDLSAVTDNAQVRKLMEAASKGQISEAVREYAQQFNQDTGDKRGYIQFGAERKFNIALLEKANLSTFLHETGHFYLEVLGDLAQAEGASDQVKADYAALLKWFGVESRDQIETKHHEMFARANEAYLMEGDAPSAELRGVFQRFKAWLTMIYREFSRLDVKLSNEVRGVFDRIYATDQEIEAAKHDVDVSPLFLDAATAGMTEQEFAAYVASVTSATQAGKDALQTKLMREYLRERQAWWKDELGKVREEVAAEVNAQPVYRAFDALVDGKVGDTPIKLNKDGLIEKYGAEYVKRLPRGFQRIYTTTGGMDADAAASFLGFESGDKLVEALAGMRNRKELIEAESQQRMRERHGDMMTDGTMADEARVAMHNIQRENILMAELRAIKRKQREVAPFVKAERDNAAADAKQAQKERAYERRWMDAERNTAEANRRAAASAATQVPPASAFRDAARGMIGQIKVRDLEPFRYLRAERQASKQAYEAMAKGDYMLAANAKQRELFNHHLYLEAMKARDEADATLKYMRRFVQGTTRQQMGKAGADYLDQIDALLERYEFARVTNKKIDRRKSLLDFINEQEAAGNEPAIDVRLMDEARRVNYRDIPVDELRAVRDAVKNIEHLARLKNKLLTKQGAVEFRDAIAELVASAENNGTRTPLPLDQAAMTRMEKAGDKVSRLDAMLLKTEQIVEWLDGGNVNGAWHTYLWNPIAQAQTDEMDLTQELTAKIVQSLEQMPKEQRLSMLDTFEVPGMGKVTRKFIVSIAMNMGNQGNLDKMMRGFGWDMKTIEGALAKLNESDIRFVQQTLDTINSLWPKIAELEKRMTGLEPEKVDSHTFEVKGADGRVMGTISGYFPLVYDPRKSEAGAKQETGSLGQLFEEGYVRATTPKGHTKLRTEGFAAPLMLDFEQVITQHLAKVVKDLTHREAVVGINRILTNPEIRNVLQETLGPAYEKQMLPWLRSVVNDRNGGSTQGLSDFSRWMMQARANVVAATMGFKATTAIAQITGLSQSLDKVSAKHLSQALLEFLRHPIALTREVRERSGEMRHRADTLDRDIRDQLRNLTGQNSTWAQAQKFAFHGIAIADAMVAVPTWMGAYRQAIEAGASEDTALLEADAAVRLTQGSGGAKDLAAIQRNNELAKTLTMFYSYFSVLYNRLHDMGRDVQEIRDMPRFLARVFFTVMFPAVMSELILGRGPKDDEDGWLWAIKKVLLYPLMSVPVLRDVASSMDSGFDYKFSPIATGIEKVAKLTTATGKLIEGDVEWPDYAAKVAETIGYVFGVAGTAQLNATGKYLWRVSEGEEQPDNIAELIYYATVGKRKE